MRTAEGGNFVLYVSDQSFNITPVDIKVYIDGRLAVDDEFDVGIQHSWYPFSFQLANGTHMIKAVSVKGEATLERAFNVTGRNWAVVQYWYYPEMAGGTGPTPRHFSFDIQDTQILFM